jgi:putative transposase
VKRKRFSVEQIGADLKQTEAGTPVAELIRHVGISEQTFYRWKKNYAGLQTDPVRRSISGCPSAGIQRRFDVTTARN